MENATKALLIAAAVLIVIVLIALGVSLLNAGGDTSKQVEGISGEISDVTGVKVEDIVDDLLSMSGSEITICLADFDTREIKNTTKISVTKGKTWESIIGKKFEFTYKNIISGEIGVNTYTEGHEDLVAVKIKRKTGTNKVEPFLYLLKENGSVNVYWNDTIETGKCYCFFLGESVYINN